MEIIERIDSTDSKSSAELCSIISSDSIGLAFAWPGSLERCTNDSAGLFYTPLSSKINGNENNLHRLSFPANSLPFTVSPGHNGGVNLQKPRGLPIPSLPLLAPSINTKQIPATPVSALPQESRDDSSQKYDFDTSHPHRYQDSELRQQYRRAFEQHRSSFSTAVLTYTTAKSSGSKLLKIKRRYSSPTRATATVASSRRFSFINTHNDNISSVNHHHLHHCHHHHYGYYRQIMSLSKPPKKIDVIKTKIQSLFAVRATTNTFIAKNTESAMTEAETDFYPEATPVVENNKKNYYCLNNNNPIVMVKNTATLATTTLTADPYTNISPVKKKSSPVTSAAVRTKTAATLTVSAEQRFKTLQQLQPQLHQQQQQVLSKSTGMLSPVMEFEFENLLLPPAAVANSSSGGGGSSGTEAKERPLSSLSNSNYLSPSPAPSLLYRNSSVSSKPSLSLHVSGSGSVAGDGGEEGGEFLMMMFPPPLPSSSDGNPASSGTFIPLPDDAAKGPRSRRTSKNLHVEFIL
ncbi:hypothetical protein HK100_008037 [Physocladia obscura]|uniref:Uncharacterized protein n=1 Tax=Physocladia obscura TaxID=109957 RepID=A0AAD5SPH5_9FUNG|nr:hypothetical protein HK100_008037 [Physocladia obscura]